MAYKYIVGTILETTHGKIVIIDLDRVSCRFKGQNENGLCSWYNYENINNEGIT